MTARQRRRRSALVLALSLGLAGCTGDGGQEPSGTASERSEAAAASRATACRAAARGVVDVTQRYVDGYAEVAMTSTPGDRESSPSPSPTPTGATDADLQTAVDEAQRVRRRQRCDVSTFDTELESGLAGVSAEGVVATAVLRQLRANLTGRAGTEPVTRAVSPADDLAAVLAESATGSTLDLAPGTYRLDETLVLLRGVTLRSSDQAGTVISSTALDAAVLVLTGERVVLESLTVRRTGDGVGSVLIGGSEASLQLRGVRIEGARLGTEGGGAGVLMTAAASEEPSRGTTLEVTDSVLVDNEGAGIALTGTHRASILTSDFRRNGQCGVCFLADSGGAVRRSTFTGNGSAVAVTADADPVVDGNQVDGGRVGIQATGDSAPVLTDNVITGVRRAAIIYADDAAGRVAGTRCARVPFGIVVGGTASPLLGKNDCQVARGR